MSVHGIPSCTGVEKRMKWLVECLIICTGKRITNLSEVSAESSENPDPDPVLEENPVEGPVKNPDPVRIHIKARIRIPIRIRIQ